MVQIMNRFEDGQRNLQNIDRLVLNVTQTIWSKAQVLRVERTVGLNYAIMIQPIQNVIDCDGGEII